MTNRSLLNIATLQVSKYSMLYAGVQFLLDNFNLFKNKQFDICLYPFHIKQIMRSQMRFENNAVWCERSEAALFDSGVRKAAFYMGGLLLPREVFWKRILAKSRNLWRCGCQYERVHPIMRREKRLWTASCMDGKRSISLHFLNHTRQNTEIRHLVWKQTEAHLSVATVRWINWKRS